MTITYGKISGRFLAAVTDGPDADYDPDLVPLGGYIEFRLNVDKVLLTTPPQVIATTPFRGVLDREGYLTTPNGPDAGDVRALTVLPTDDPALNPTDLQYTVTYVLQTSEGVKIPLRSHPLVVPAGETVDLALVMPPDAAKPVGVAAAEAAAAVSAEYAREAGDLAERAEAEAKAAREAADKVEPLTKDVPGGVPGLDGNARVPDARLPERLAAQELQRTFVAVRTLDGKALPPGTIVVITIDKTLAQVTANPVADIADITFQTGA